MKKGFTLIEVLAVIVILSMLGLIVFPEIKEVITNSKEKSYNTQINSIIDATKRYVTKDTTFLPIEDGIDYKVVTLETLKLSGELESDIIYDPRTSGELLTGCVIIKYSTVYNQYVYEYVEDIMVCP